MTIDILDYTEDQLKNLSKVQMQLLRTAQKKKNALKTQMESELEAYKKQLLTNGMKESTLYAQKREELSAKFIADVEILTEQLEYDLIVNDPYPSQEEDQAQVGYRVDYSLPYVDRFNIVKDYYLAIPDPAERMILFGADDVARRYLGSYFATLYSVLYSYAK